MRTLGPTVGLVRAGIPARESTEPSAYCPARHDRERPYGVASLLISKASITARPSRRQSFCLQKMGGSILYATNETV
jgi:hypothetical protein